MSMEERKIFQYDAPFTLESGTTIPGYRLAYHTLGTLNETKSNVVWVFHALTGSSEVGDWWAGLVGGGKLFDPERYFIICVNMPGSCYGSTGPLDLDPVTGKTWMDSITPLSTDPSPTRRWWSTPSPGWIAFSISPPW